MGRPGCGLRSAVLSPSRLRSAASKSSMPQKKQPAACASVPPVCAPPACAPPDCASPGCAPRLQNRQCLRKNRPPPALPSRQSAPLRSAVRRTAVRRTAALQAALRGSEKPSAGRNVKSIKKWLFFEIKSYSLEGRRGSLCNFLSLF